MLLQLPKLNWHLPSKLLRLAIVTLIANRLSKFHGRVICLLGHLQETVQAAQAEKAKIEDSRSTLTFEVEVVHFQAYLQAEMVPGRFLLAAERGKVEGRHVAQLAQNVTTVDLQQVGGFSELLPLDTIAVGPQRVNGCSSWQKIWLCLAWERADEHSVGTGPSMLCLKVAY